MLRIKGDRGPGLKLHRGLSANGLPGNRVRAPETSRAAAQYTSHEWAEKCFHPECGGIITPGNKAARFKIGRVLYTDSGDNFEPEPLWNSKEVVYTHIECAHRAGVLSMGNTPMLELDYGWCRLCNMQFYCEVEPMELAIQIDTGVLYEGKKSFVTRFKNDYEGGCVHWPCAADCWTTSLLNVLTPHTDRYE